MNYLLDTHTVLILQSLSENLTLITKDRILRSMIAKS